MDWVSLSLCCVCLAGFAFASGLVVVLIAIRLYLNYTLGICKSSRNMNGKTVLITGPTSGIGRVTAFEIAKRGARLVLGCRNIDAANKLKDEIVEKTGNPHVVVYKLDLSILSSVRTFAADVIRNEKQLDVLIHNAGVAGMWQPAKSLDGIELTYATNHYGPFLLTHLLADLLKKSAPSRVVIVASDVYKFANINLTNMNPTNFWPNSYLYFNSKFLNIHFSNELARRLQGTGVTVNCLHPGFIETGIWRNLHVPFNWGLKLVALCFFKTIEQGAQTTIHLAVSDEVEGVTGKYFMDCRETSLWSKATNEDIAKKIWELSETMVKLKETDPKL